MRLDRRGMTLIETMIAGAVMAVIILASLSMLSPILRLKKQMDADTGLNLVLTQFRDCIANDVAWDATVRSPRNTAAMGCLAAGSACVDGTPSVNIEILNKSGQPCISGGGAAPGAPPSGMTTYDPLSPVAGFAMDGTVCTAFNATKGNSACPFHLAFTWMATCPGGGSCLNPLIHVIGTMTYNAGDATKVNEGRYGINEVRGRADRVKRFVLREWQPSGTSSTSACDPATPRYRQFNQIPDLASPDYLPVGGPAPGGNGTFILNAGTYSCEISAPAYGVGGHQIRLERVSDGVPLLTGTSEFANPTGPGVQSRSFASGTFNVDADGTVVGVRHYCQNASGTGMGSAISLGLQETYAVMSCSVIAR